jgi:hypothetical protein
MYRGKEIDEYWCKYTQTDNTQSVYSTKIVALTLFSWDTLCYNIRSSQCFEELHVSGKQG